MVFFFRERLETDSMEPLHVRVLSVPSLVDDETAAVYLKQAEAEAIADCLDHLPFSPLAWSIHRGMKEILIAYALPYMLAYRDILAKQLRQAVYTHASALYEKGWRDREFITKSVA